LAEQNEIVDFMLRYDDKVSGLAILLRDYLFKTLPDIHEQLDISARIIGYGYGPKYIDTICTIIPSKKGLKLGFYKGTELPDPAGLLTGSGKVHRYVVINSEKDIKSAPLKKLLKEALQAYKMRTASNL
jgi:hypothetical protein